MGSALRASGSTTQWRKLRANYARELEAAGAVPCWRCGELVSSEEPWALGHIVDRALGGDDSHLAIEHLHCSRRSGWALGRAIRAAKMEPRVTAADDELFPDMIITRSQ